MVPLLVGLLLLLGLSVAHAGDYVGESTVTPGQFTSYLTQRDPTQALPKPNEVLHLVPEAQTAAQQAINVGQPYATPPVPPSVPQKYRKVVNGLVVEMTQAEKDEKDQALALAAAPKQSWQNELNTNDLCQHLLVQGLEDYYDAVKADIDVEVETNSGTIRDADRELNVKLVREIRKLAKVVCGTINVRR